jgi:hypothetical protein
MPIPTRTPEGEPHRCPVCGTAVVIAPSAFPTPDAPCSACGQLLWLSGNPDREVGWSNAELAGVRSAIRRGEERLGELKKQVAEARPVEASVGLQVEEITDPFEIVILELGFQDSPSDG